MHIKAPNTLLCVGGFVLSTQVLACAADTHTMTLSLSTLLALATLTNVITFLVIILAAKLAWDMTR